MCPIITPKKGSAHDVRGVGIPEAITKQVECTATNAGSKASAAQIQAYGGQVKLVARISETRVNTRILAKHSGGLCADLNDLNYATRERKFKRFTTLQARAALLGATLHKQKSGDNQARYIASRRWMTAEFPDLESVETWLTNVTDELSAGDI